MPSWGVWRREVRARTYVSEEVYRFQHHGGKNQRVRNVVSGNYADIVASILILFNLIMEAKRSFEISALTQGDGILHSHCHENLKSYIALTGWTL
jgi:hypothetical protein